MSDKDVSHFLFQTIKECCDGKLSVPLTLDTRMSDLRIDSLNMIQIVYELENHFDVEIPENCLFELDTLADLLALVQRARAVSAA